jgi:hypothetical protein
MGSGVSGAAHANGASYEHGLNGAGSESSAGPEVEQPPAANSVEIYTAEELKGMEFPPVKFICDGIIAEGCTILGGRPKMGKSWLALDLAYGVATGEQVMGRDCEQGDVLYCALEDNPRRIQTRLRRITRDDDDDCDWPSSLYFANMWPKGRDTISAFDAWRKSVKNPKLIIVDTLKKIKSKSSGGQGDTYFDDYEAVELLQKFYLDTGISVLLLTHTRKETADDPFDTITGTLGQTGAADNIMVMARGSDGEITLHGTGRDMEEYTYGMRFDKAACKWEIKEPVTVADLMGMKAPPKENAGKKAFSEAFNECAIRDPIRHQVGGDGPVVIAVDGGAHKDEFFKRYPGEHDTAKRAYNRALKSLYETGAYCYENTLRQTFIWRLEND